MRTSVRGYGAMDRRKQRRDNAAVNRSRLWLLPVLLVFLVLGAWWFGYRADRGGGDRELPVYVTGGERLAAGEEIYRRGVDAKPFTYPPFAAVPFVPFAVLPKKWQPAAWFAINFVILILLARWLHGYAKADFPGLGPPRLVWFWVITGLVGARHVPSVLTNQSHDLFIAGLVAMTAAAWLRGRSVAGLWAGLGAAVKATPLLLVGLFGLRLRFVALALMAIGVVGPTLLPDLVCPRTDGGAWWRAWIDGNLRELEVGGTASAQGIWNSHAFLNQSLSGTLVRLFTPVTAPQEFVVGDTGDVLLVELAPGLFKVVSLLAQLSVLAAITWGVLGAARTVRRATSALAAQWLLGLGEVGAFACGMVLLSPQSSKSHFCVWLFPVAFVANRLLRGHRDRVALALLIAGSIVGLLAKDLVGKELGNHLLACGNVTWATVLFLLATVRCLRTARVDERVEAAPAQLAR